ncbi:hypothetical protein ACLOJK_033981 [Asimina triloba]
MVGQQDDQFEDPETLIGVEKGNIFTCLRFRKPPGDVVELLQRPLLDYPPLRHRGAAIAMSCPQMIGSEWKSNIREGGIRVLGGKISA